MNAFLHFINSTKHLVISLKNVHIINFVMSKAQKAKSRSIYSDKINRKLITTIKCKTILVEKCGKHLILY